MDTSTIITTIQKKVEIIEMFYYWLHYEKKLTKNIRPTDVLQIYTSI